MNTLFLGSIGTLVETSEIQRAAFNKAFETHGLDWHWSQDRYADLLKRSGGKKRIESFASSNFTPGKTVDADALYQTKCDHFEALMAQTRFSPREGVQETIAAAKEQGFKVGLVTSTTTENVQRILSGIAPSITKDTFDVIVDLATVDQRKPKPDCYQHALARLGVSASQCVAIEDNEDGVSAATAAGITCIAVPGVNTSTHDFSSAAKTISQVSFAAVRDLLDGALAR